MNGLKPALAVIQVGSGQGSTYNHPRIDVVEKVLLAQASCVTAPAALVLQTEEGSPVGSQTSFAGFCVGDVVLKTAGVDTFQITATGAVSQGPDERTQAGIGAGGTSFPLDGFSDTLAPAATVLAPNGGESWAAGSVQTIQWSATDNVGVSSVTLSYSTSGPSGPFQTISAGEANDGSYSWTVPNLPSTNVFVKATAFDAASNSGEDLSDAPFTITAPPPPPALHVHGLTVQNVYAGSNRWFGRALVTVHDQNHLPISGVVVTGNWSGLAPQTGDTGLTNASGVATVDSNKKKNPKGQFCFDVTGLTLSPYVYDQALDAPVTPPAVCGPSLN